MKYSFRGVALALAALSLCASPAFAANKRAVVVSSGAIRPLPAGDTVLTNAATTANASINLPHGTAPTAPLDGDCWTTTVSAFCRIAGVTVDLGGGGGGAGTVTSVGVSGGTTGLSTSGGPVTTSGTIALAGTLDLDNGGTGAATAAAARTNLGLGTLATQSGTFSGTSSGSNSGDQDLSALQPLDADLTAIAALATTAAGRALLDDLDAAAQRTTLGLGTLATQSGTFSGTTSGSNTGDQASVSGNAGTATALATGRTLAITGDLAWTSPSFDGSGNVTAAGTIAVGAVTLAKQADMATASVVYRKTAAAGAPEVQTLATLKTDLGLTGTNSGDQANIAGITGTIAQFNTAVTDADLAPVASPTFTGTVTLPAGAWINAADATGRLFFAAADYSFYKAPVGHQWRYGSDTVIGSLTATGLNITGTIVASGAVSGSNLSGTNTGDQTITLTGNVTGSGTGSFATTIANSAVTLAKMADVATDSILGRATAATGNVEVLTALPWAFTGDVTRPADSNATTIAPDAVTFAKLQNVSATARAICRKTAAAGDAEECTLSELLDFVGSAAQGDVLYRGATTWARLGAGTSGQVLQSGGAAANPSWVTPAVSAKTVIAGNSGTANGGAAGAETWQVLTADATVNLTATIATVMTTTALPAGTWKYRYDILAQGGLTTTTPKFSVDATGTVTKSVYHMFFPSQGVTAATGVADQDQNVTTGAVWAHQSTRTDNTVLGPLTDLDTANADVHFVIEGILITTTSGNLLLGHASELAAASTVTAGTMLQLWRLN